jgi:hypothetical protein
MTRPGYAASLVLLFVLVAPARLFACPVCFQNVESSLLDAARLGVLSMVAVTVCILAAFGAFFLRLRRLASVGAGVDAAAAGEPS